MINRELLNLISTGQKVHSRKKRLRSSRTIPKVSLMISFLLPTNKSQMNSKAPSKKSSPRKNWKTMSSCVTDMIINIFIFEYNIICKNLFWVNIIDSYYFLLISVLLLVLFALIFLLTLSRTFVAVFIFISTSLHPSLLFAPKWSMRLEVFFSWLEIPGIFDG